MVLTKLGMNRDAIKLHNVLLNKEYLTNQTKKFSHVLQNEVNKASTLRGILLTGLILCVHYGFTLGLLWVHSSEPGVNPEYT